MCRSIRPLFNLEPPTTDDEIRAAALQYVRKVAGTRKPSRENEAAFQDAVEQIAAATRVLVRERLSTRAAPQTREAQAARAKLRVARRVRERAAPAPSTE